MLELSFLHNVFFFEHLHCQEFFCIFFLNQKHLPVGALPYHFEERKIIGRELWGYQSLVELSEPRSYLFEILHLRLTQML